MDAASFITFLRASNPVWHEDDADPPQWIFRGHRNAAWRLKPRAWRIATEGNPLRSMIGKLARAQISDRDDIKPGTTLHRALAWIHTERLVLNEFRRIGWHLGFEVNEPVSSYSMDLKYGPAVIDDMRNETDSFSPFFSSDIGVAQHYGVPTRFLDWTFNPIFAIFFAQDEQAPNLDQSDLCVWALDMNAIDLMLHWEDSVGRNLLRAIVPRRRGNEFITAQDGLLLEIEHKWALEFFERNATWPSVQEVVVALNGELEYREDGSYVYDVPNAKAMILHPMLRRIVLPAREIPKLRLMLEREGITREKLMPTLENVSYAAIRAISQT
jgi:hypothetical protein